MWTRRRTGGIITGGLAQLARAPALQAGGHRFDSDILHGCAEAVSRSITKTADSIDRKDHY